MRMSQKLPHDVLAAVRHETARQDESTQETRSFYVADMSRVDDLLDEWRKELPTVTPFYAMKTNQDRGLLRRLASLDINFDCASINEIRELVALEIDPHRMIFSHPIKTPASLTYACDLGVSMTVFDSEEELHKIKAYFPQAKLLLRLAVDENTAGISLSDKFGASKSIALRLLDIASEMGLMVVGLCFHAGSPSLDPSTYVHALRHALWLSKSARLNLEVLDIGGGFISPVFAQIAREIHQELSSTRELYPDVNIIAEPGRYFAQSPFWLACQVVGRRADAARPRLYLNDGVFGNFMNAIVEKQEYQPDAIIRGSKVERQSGHGKRLYSLWGPTCDSLDCITQDASFDGAVEIGDWLVFGDMGAYTSACRTGFNGFDTRSEVIYLNV